MTAADRKPANQFYDMIEKLIREGLTINDTARRLRISAHSVIKCCKERSELAAIAKASGLKKQGRKLPWEL